MMNKTDLRISDSEVFKLMLAEGNAETSATDHHTVGNVQ